MAQERIGARQFAVILERVEMQLRLLAESQTGLIERVERHHEEAVAWQRQQEAHNALVMKRLVDHDRQFEHIDRQFEHISRAVLELSGQVRGLTERFGAHERMHLN